jgi:YD repeat-containing protein
VTATSAEGMTATMELDDWSRPIGSQQPGLADTTLSNSARGHLTSVIEEGASEETRETNFGYDPTDGWLRSILDPEGQEWSFTPDEVGRVTQATRPDGDTTGLGYDDRGMLDSVTPPGRDAHEFSFDDYGHTTGYYAPSLEGYADPEQELAFTYTADHQLETATVGPWAITYDYEPTSGRLTTMTWPLDGATATTTVSYDTAGRPYRVEAEERYPPVIDKLGLRPRLTRASRHHPPRNRR